MTLTVTDNEGATDDVLQRGDRHGTPGNQAPTAAFTVECSSLECTFTNASTDADGTIASYAWDFGEPAQPGQHLDRDESDAHLLIRRSSTEVTVTLTVTDDDG